MYRTFRSVLLAPLALLMVSAPLLTETAAVAVASSRVLPPPDPSHGTYSRAQAREVLARATHQLRPDNRRLSARRPVVRAAGTDTTTTLRDLFLARSALGAADRRDADALLSRGRVLGDGSTDPTTVSTPKLQCSTNFCVHYRDPAPGDRNATQPAQVRATLDTLESVRAFETGRLGYRAPVSDTPATPTPDNPDGRFDVFLGDIAQEGVYGYCAPDGDAPTSNGHAPAFCVLDNDYARSQYGTVPLDALRVTAAHEFFHAIQFAYDVNEDSWFMEGTATWVEDEVYDSINDNYQYLYESAIRDPRRSLDYSVGLYPYGSFLFFKYVSERLHSPTVVRQFWEYADASQDRFSLLAIRAVVAAHHMSWASFFSLFASWNTLPAHSYSERAHYPGPSLTASSTLAKRSPTTGWRTVGLPHLSSSAIRVAPSSRLSTRARLLIEVNAPDTSHGSTALVQRRYLNGAVTHSLMALDRYGNGRLLIGFNRRVLASVVLVVSNTSSAMRDCGRVGAGSGGPVYSCYGRGYYDNGQTFGVRISLR